MRQRAAPFDDFSLLEGGQGRFFFSSSLLLSAFCFLVLLCCSIALPGRCFAPLVSLGSLYSVRVNEGNAKKQDFHASACCGR